MAKTKAQSVAEKRAYVAEVWERHTPPVAAIDPLEYPAIDGMWDPARVPEHAGRVLYWDPSEQAYYDRKSDLYLYEGSA